MNALTIIHSILLTLNFLVFFAVWLQLRASAKKGADVDKRTAEWKKENLEWKAEVRGKLEALHNKLS